MVDYDIDKYSSPLDTKNITNFRELCDGISKLDARIAGAMAIKNGKILAASEGAGSALPGDEYLSKLIVQAQVLVGIPLANKAFFGDYNFTIVSYETLESILFHLEKEKVILGVGVLPPYDRNSMVEKIQIFLKQYRETWPARVINE
jgi:hypothetical protein